MDIEVVKEICSTIGAGLLAILGTIALLIIIFALWNQEVKTVQKKKEYIKNLNDEQKAIILEYGHIKAKLFERKKK